MARCTVERLMTQLGLRGALRGGKQYRTTIPDAAPVPPSSGQPPVPGSAAQPAVGGRFHLCGNLVGRGLCGVRHQCLFPPNRGLAGIAFHEG